MVGIYLDGLLVNLKLNVVFNVYFFLWCFFRMIQIGLIIDFGELVIDLFVGLMILVQWVFLVGVGKQNQIFFRQEMSSINTKFFLFRVMLLLG